MIKGIANLFGANATTPTSAPKSLRRAVAQTIETLEARVLLSTTPPTIDILWNGKQVPAVQGQYIAQTNNFNAWSKLVTTQGFTNINNLGGNGFYEFQSTLSPSEIAALSKAHPVALPVVQPNFVEHADNTFPNDSEAFNQWYLQNTGQNEPFYYNPAGFFPGSTVPPQNQIGTPGQDIDATQAWDLTTGSSNVVVAVLDTGIDTTHPDLIPNLWTNPNPNGQPGFANDLHGWNFIDDTNDVTDLNGHGTNVAGVIGAAGNNTFGVTGVNWHVSLLTVKVLDAEGAGSDAAIVSGINYVTMLKSQGVNVVVMNESLGGGAFPLDVITSNAIRAAGKAGILDVVAAGNDSSNDDSSVTGSKPADFSISNPTVITVAATDNQGKLAYFSNYGAATVDLAAPGIDIYSTSPTYPVTLNAESAEMPLLPQFTEIYGYLSGTSQATPSVAGIIALEAAANPSASPAQLKKALLDGVTPDPNLAGQNDLPAKVLTAGVANAYHAVENILDQFVTKDTTRAGNWQGFYGTQGAYIVGDSTSFPSFVTTTFDGASPLILDDSSNLPAALVKISDPKHRIEAYDASATSESFTLAFNDGNMHRVGLYVADLDNKKRTEAIQLINTTNGFVLDTQVVSKFQKGEYLFYDVSNSVQFTITNLAGPKTNAVFSGIFFDGVPTSPNTFLGSDTATAGINWHNVYGSQGQDIAGDNTSQSPSYITGITLPGTTLKVLKSVTNARQALLRAVDITRGIEAYWFSPTAFDINITSNSTANHEISLYLADYDHKRRAERIQVLDPNTRAVLYSQDYFNFTSGVFANFNIPGSVIFHVIPLTGPSAVVSGIFFDGAPGSTVTFQGVDTTTKGDWKSAGYGFAQADIAGEDFVGVDDFLNGTITTQNVSEKVLSALSSDPRALLRDDSNISNDRIAAYLYTHTFMTLFFNPGDNLQHELALYFVDYEHLKRTESITITDPTTGTILTQQRISNFANGKYLLYNISGPVNITIVAGSVPNAVLSGLFVS